MAKLFSKKPDQPARTELEIDRKLANLEAHRTATVLEVKALERKGAKRVPVQDSPTTDELAARYLGDEQPKSGKSLTALDTDLTALDKAISIARQRSDLQHLELTQRLVDEAQPAWRDLVRRRALAVAALMNANAEAEAFAEALTIRTGRRPHLDLEYPAGLLLGTLRGGAGKGFALVAAAIKAKYVSEKEVADA